MFAANAACSPGVATWVQQPLGQTLLASPTPGAAIKHDLQAYREALAGGRIRQALVSAINAAESFCHAGRWMQPCSGAASPWIWRAALAGPPALACLVQMGDVLRLLARYDEVAAHLHEAMMLMAANRLAQLRAGLQQSGTTGA
ncbi:MAG: hypothetical protein IPF55_11750 [Rhodoferax sp.]|nr:hypothetical protein [Rhodoferax sp.]